MAPDLPVPGQASTQPVSSARAQSSRPASERSAQRLPSRRLRGGAQHPTRPPCAPGSRTSCAACPSPFGGAPEIILVGRKPDASGIDELARRWAGRRLWPAEHERLVCSVQRPSHVARASHAARRRRPPPRSPCRRRRVAQQPSPSSTQCPALPDHRASEVDASRPASVATTTVVRPRVPRIASAGRPAMASFLLPPDDARSASSGARGAEASQRPRRLTNTVRPTTRVRRGPMPARS